MPTIETDRLVLRLPEESDIDALDAMDSDPDVMRYIGDGKVHPRTREQTAGFVAAATSDPATPSQLWVDETASSTYG